MGRLRIVVAVALLASLPRAAMASPHVPACGTRRTVLVPVAGHAYHTAYFSSVGAETGYTDARLRWWQDLTGRHPAGIYLSNHWGTERGSVHIVFPADKVKMFWRHGSLPMIRLMPWSKRWETGADPVFTMQRIIDGGFDRPLRAWFDDAHDLGIPLMLEFGVEVNGEWFPWNGKWNGGGATDRYGSPHWPDGPERFRDAYRHVIALARQEHARTITWNFHVDADGWPKRWWNQPKWYYPGDRYIDWLSVSDYGEQRPTGNPARWNPFIEKLGNPGDASSSYRTVRRLAPDKPFAVMEFGVTEDPEAGDKAEWITDAYDSMTGTSARYDVSLVNYWSEKWTNGDGSRSDLRVQSSAGALAAYRTAIAGSFFATSPSFGCD